MGRPEITITRAMLREHDACYTDEQIDATGLTDGVSLVDVLRCDRVPVADRVWVGAHFAPLRVRYEWLANTVERALARVEKPDLRSLAVVPLLRRLSRGEVVSPHALRVAMAAASAAAAEAAAEAAWSAAGAVRTAWASRWSSMAAARAAAWAAGSAARAEAERRAQLDDMMRLLEA